MLPKQISYNANIYFMFVLWVTGAPYCQGSSNYLVLGFFPIQFSNS